LKCLNSGGKELNSGGKELNSGEKELNSGEKEEIENHIFLYLCYKSREF